MHLYVYFYFGHSFIHLFFLSIIRWFFHLSFFLLIFRWLVASGWWQISLTSINAEVFFFFVCLEGILLIVLILFEHVKYVDWMSWTCLECFNKLKYYWLNIKVSKRRLTTTFLIFWGFFFFLLTGLILLYDQGENRPGLATKKQDEGNLGIL